MNAVLISFIVYLVLVFFVGIMTCRLSKTLSDYLIAGRKLGPWVVAFSERASGESAWLLIGVPGIAFASGFLGIWPAVGCTAGIMFSWIFIARKLRTDTERYDAITVPDYFEARFTDRSRILRIFTACVIIFFFTIYVAAQFLAAGKVLNAAFNIPEFWGMVIGAAVILFYTVMGGFFAVAWTDLVQGIIMVFTLVLLPIAALIALGGFARAAESIRFVNPQLLNVTGVKSGFPLFLAITGALGIGLGYMGQPHLVARFMAINDRKELKKSMLIASLWALLAFWGATFIGIFGIAFLRNGLTEGISADLILKGGWFKDTAVLGTLISDPEKLMPVMAKALMPPVIAGIMISGAIAAMMSTADSQLLASTSAVTEDIYHHLFKKNADQKELILVSRIATITIGIVAFLIAIFTRQLVYHLVLFAWGGLGAVFGPAMFFSLWWKKATKAGILAGMIVALLTIIVINLIPVFKATHIDLVFAFLLSIAAITTVSLTGKKAH